MIMQGAAPANRALREEFVRVVQNDGRLDRIGDYIAPDIVDHDAMPGAPAGIDGVRAIIGAIRAAFPDHDARIVQIVAEGDLVATYKTFTGTHAGDFFGLPPTGRRATIRVMDFVRYQGGKVVEHWNIVDHAGLMAQLKG